MSSHSAAGTVGGALASATARLRTANIPSPRLDAELLLGHLLQLSRTRLAIDANEPIDPKTALELESLVERRLAGEPVAYLIGHREFMGHDFRVGQGVLVPRPETEMLVELAVEMIERRWPVGPVRVLDVGTGSGAIALSLALLTSERVRIAASDISSDALRFARMNRAHLGLEHRVTLIRGDLLTWTRGPWDLILSNPPYLRPDQIEGNWEISAEPRLALDGGQQGLEPIERMLAQSVAIVGPRFGMLIELDPDNAALAGELAQVQFPTASVRIVPDLTGRDRFLSIERDENSEE